MEVNIKKSQATIRKYQLRFLTNGKETKVEDVEPNEGESNTDFIIRVAASVAEYNNLEENKLENKSLYLI